MSNPRNHGSIIGRLAQDPRSFANKDGSQKVVFTVFADRNYTNAQNERQSDAIPVEAFVRAQVKGLGPYGNIHQGDLVSVNYALRMDRYNKNGSEVFDLKVVAEDITFLESRTVTQARLADRLKAVTEQNKAVAQQVQTVTAEASAVDEQLPFG